VGELQGAQAAIGRFSARSKKSPAGASKLERRLRKITKDNIKPDGPSRVSACD
jgi:hypothetical protein